MRRSGCMVYCSYAYRTASILPGLAKAHSASQTSRSHLGTHFFPLEEYAKTNFLLTLRVRRAIGVDNLDEWPDVKAWLERFMARPGVQAGILVPE